MGHEVEASPSVPEGDPGSGLWAQTLRYPLVDDSLLRRRTSVFLSSFHSVELSRRDAGDFVPVWGRGRVSPGCRRVKCLLL